MLALLRKPRWSPYVVGTGIGVLSWATFYFMSKALGTSTTMVNCAAGIEGLVAQGHVEANAYFAKAVVSTADKARPLIEWQFALVAMLAVGAFISAKLSGSAIRESVPSLWAWRFGPSKLKRYTFAFIGGIVLLFGARLADGCTSGHAISGGLQLAISSWTFTIAMFASGIATAFLMYGKAGRQHV